MNVATTSIRAIKVLLANIHANLFVRQVLNHDWALQLGELIENGVKLDNMLVTPAYKIGPGDKIVYLENGQYELIDGRHRREGYDLNSYEKVDVDVVIVETEAELIALAYNTNIGGSLPPTKLDTEHTVMALLERGVVQKKIGEMLNLPAGLARQYINNVQSKVARIKLLQATKAVTDSNLNIREAAEKYGVDQDKLKEALGGGKKKKKSNNVADTHRRLTTLYKSISQKNAALMRSLLHKLEDGDVQPFEVEEILKKLETLQKKSTRSLADWRKRFAAMMNGGEKKSEK